MSIVFGVLALIVGPGACAMSCASAARAVPRMVEACNGGISEECKERVGSEHYARTLAEVLPRLSAECGATPEFDVSETYVNIAVPWDMHAEITGSFVAGECGTDPRMVVLEGHPLSWRVVDVGPPVPRK